MCVGSPAAGPGGRSRAPDVSAGIGRGCDASPSIAGAPIGRVGLPLDHAHRLQAVEQAHERDGLDVEHGGKANLVGPLAPSELREYGALGSRQAELRCPSTLLKTLPEQAGNVVQHKS